MCVYVSGHVRVYVEAKWSSSVAIDLGFFFTSSLTWPGTHQLGKTGWPAILSNLPVSTFPVLGLQHVPPCLTSKK